MLFLYHCKQGGISVMAEVVGRAFTVIATVFDVAGLPLSHAALEVNKQLT